MREVGIFLVIILSMYLLEAFVFMEFNPAMWEERQRALLAIGGCALGLVWARADSDIKKRESKKKK